MPAQTLQRYCVAVRGNDSQSRRKTTDVTRRRLEAADKHDAREEDVVSGARPDVNGTAVCCEVQLNVMMGSVITRRSDSGALPCMASHVQMSLIRLAGGSMATSPRGKDDASTPRW